MGSPIVILFIPRSGSSMVAGCFAQHVDPGDCHEMIHLNPKGVYAHKELDKFLKENYKSRGEIVKEAHVLPKEMPRMFKCAVQYWRVFLPFNPHYIFVRVDPEYIIKSSRRFGDKFVVGGDKPIRVAIDERFKEMDYIKKVHGGVDVDTAAVAQGDLSTLREAIEYCGLEFNEEKCREFIEPDLWGI